MARIVAGIGTGHTPLISEPPEFWAEHGASELKNPQSMENAHGGGNVKDLIKQREAKLASQVTLDAYRARYQQIQEALDGVKEVLNRVKPDVLVTVGDDQRDAFLFDYMPAMCVYRGETIVSEPADLSKMPPFRASWVWGYKDEKRQEYPCDANLATHLVKSLIRDEFDVAYLTEPAEGREIGHAFTFINRRLMPENPIPQVPFMLNTYFPPNTPVARRCWSLGQSMRKAIESWDSDKTVAIVASGGLSHPIVDEELDRAILEAIQKNDGKWLGDLDENVFRLGTSEVKNWITVAGVMSGTGMGMKTIDYIPAYRTTAGTGCGIAFTHWG